MKPMAIDLFTGLHGWAEGLVAEGWRVVGFDIEDMCGQFGAVRPEYVQLVLQDVLTIHGKQFKDAALIVASPPCQEFSYMAMPWSKAKQKAIEYRNGTRDVKQLTALFDACFRIQREACEAAGHHIPLVVENVRGAQPWVGRSRWAFGSFHLWGDVPALMPMTRKGILGEGVKAGDRNKCGANGEHKWTTSFAVSLGTEASVRRISEAHRSKSPAKGYGVVTEDGIKHGGISEGLKWGECNGKRFDERPKGNVAAHREGTKQGGISGPRVNGKGDAWFQDGAAKHGSKSNARKAASAMIAKIPTVLAQWIAKTYHPERVA
jgi:hypothetical protein